MSSFSTCVLAMNIPIRGCKLIVVWLLKNAWLHIVTEAIDLVDFLLGTIVILSKYILVNIF